MSEETDLNSHDRIGRAPIVLEKRIITKKKTGKRHFVGFRAIYFRIISGLQYKIQAVFNYFFQENSDEESRRIQMVMIDFDGLPREIHESPKETGL